MGAISDGSFRDVATYNKQMRELYTLQNGGGYETHSVWGSALATALPSLFMTLGSKIGASDGSDAESETGDSSKLAEDIQADIDNTLSNVGCSDISEVQTKLQTAQSDLQKINTDINSKESQITQLSKQISELTRVTEDEYDSPELMLNKAKAEQLNAQKAALEAELKALKAQQTEKKEEVEKYSQALNNLKTLQKQLKKAEGRDAIENLVNNESKDFSKALTELRDAIQSGNQDLVNTKALLVEDAYNKYLKEHPDAKNRTIERGYDSVKKYIKAAKETK